jgi:hypothetical protein
VICIRLGQESPVDASPMDGGISPKDDIADNFAPSISSVEQRLDALGSSMIKTCYVRIMLSFT